MHRPGRKFANFGLFLCICPVTLTAGVTADKEASTTTTAQSSAAAQLEANKAVIGPSSMPGTAATSAGSGP